MQRRETARFFQERERERMPSYSLDLATLFEHLKVKPVSESETGTTKINSAGLAAKLLQMQSQRISGG